MVKNFLGEDRLGAERINLARTVYTIHRGTGLTLTLDQIKDRQALENLNGNWGCKLLRVLLYKLHQPGD